MSIGSDAGFRGSVPRIINHEGHEGTRRCESRQGFLRAPLCPSWLIGSGLALIFPHAYDAAFMNSRTPGRPVEVHQKAQLMSASEVERTLIRLAHEILEKNNGVEDLALVGIRRRGVPLAERLAKIIQRIEKKPVLIGTLDITLYRDDLSSAALGAKPVVQKTEMEIPITGKSVVLVDDVLYTGRTTRAAMDALFRAGRPRRLQLCVLIDRGHRELPIEAAFIGRTVQTTENQMIEVKLREVDDAEKVLLMEKQPGNL
jgi:pyrimidine operon attenuation protein/uracil phosphoribosyltransferase